MSLIPDGYGRSIYAMAVIAMVMVSCSPRIRPEEPASASVSRARPLVVPALDKFRNYEHAIAGMDKWERYYAARKLPQAAFFTAHAETLRALQDWGSKGRFADPRMVERYAVTFANAVRDAVARNRSNADISGAWKVFFESGEIDHLTALMLGINAHINYDLTHVILDAGIDARDSDAWIEDQRVLAAILAVLPRIRRAIYDRYPKNGAWYQKAFGSWLDRRVERAFYRTRKAAWCRAMLSISATTGAKTPIQVADAMNRFSTDGALQMKRSGNNLLKQLRIFESASQSCPASKALR